MSRQNKRNREARRFGSPSRLVDIIAAGDWFMAGGDDDTKRKVESIAANAKAFDAAEVSEYFYAQNSKHDWSYDSDFPPMAVPFSTFFLEFARPSRLLSGEVAKAATMFPDKFGWLVIASDVNEMEVKGEAQLATLVQEAEYLERVIDRNKIQESIKNYNDPSKCVHLGPNEISYLRKIAMIRSITKGEPLLPPEYKWSMESYLFISHAGRTRLWASSGCIVTDSGKIAGYPIYGIYDDKSGAEERDTANALFLPVIMTLGFMNCKKGVAYRDIAPDPQINKERRKHGRKPFLRYSTIEIDGMKQVLRTERGIETNGLKKALHICRGHFATYADSMLGRKLDSPITVWRPSHIRGSAKHGVVVSDYVVKAGVAKEVKA